MSEPHHAISIERRHFNSAKNEGPHAASSRDAQEAIGGCHPVNVDLTGDLLTIDFEPDSNNPEAYDGISTVILTAELMPVDALSKLRNLRVQRDALRRLTDAQAVVIAEETGSHAWTIAYARMQEAKKVAERLAPKAAPFQESMLEPEAETQPIAPKMDKITRLGK